jgi:fluoroquinolone transport system permease protein
MRGALRWYAIVGSAALAFGSQVLLRATGAEHTATTDLRRTAVLLCAGAAFALDDAGAETVQPSPFTLLMRRALRVGITMLFLVTAWFAFIALAVDTPVSDVGRHHLEFFAFAAISLGVSSMFARGSGESRGSLHGAGAVLFASTFALLLPGRWAMFVSPDSPRWHDAGRDITIVLVLACALTIWFSLDPARRVMSIRRKRRRFDAAGGVSIGTAAQRGGGS